MGGDSEDEFDGLSSFQLGPSHHSNLQLLTGEEKLFRFDDRNVTTAQNFEQQNFAVHESS